MSCASAMILAAGRGERLRPLTDTVPKPLVEVGGKALIVRHLEQLAAAGCQRVVINLSWLGHKVRTAVGDGSEFGLSIIYSDEGEQALETGGGIFKALPLLGEKPFLVLNGDVYCDYPLAEASLAPGLLAHLILVPNPPHNARGDFGLQESRVVAHGELHTFSGIGVYDPAIFARCHEGKFPLAPVLHAAIETGRVSGELWQGEWHDLGTIARLAALNESLGQAEAQRKGDQGPGKKNSHTR